MPKQKNAILQEVEVAMQESWKAFEVYKRKNLVERARFLYTIAQELEAAAPSLIAIAQQETHLDKNRLTIELKRTIFQLTSYADACKEGTWLDIRINTKKNIEAIDNNLTHQGTSAIDLRKMLIPLGPVVIFGASNFPFAYSTAGGDTACALAAGCTVVIKAHPAHGGTSQLVAGIIKRAAKKCELPEGIFLHLEGISFDLGNALVQHPLTKAVGFTGSMEGGRALFDLANQRPIPIPVFAEMGSVNPVFILPQKLASATAEIAAMYAKSITQSAGQFCTNPGLLIGIKNEALEQFKVLLGNEIAREPSVKMLHAGIAKSFYQRRAAILSATDVSLVATNDTEVANDQSIPTLGEVSSTAFLQNPLLHQEVFGPFSLLVTCDSIDEMQLVALSLEGQLTCSLMATLNEVQQQDMLVETLQGKCGRLILNGVPTGVEVALAMHHGGPYPSTTDSRFTAVGADGIKRFARPICYQNWNNELLPDALKNENPLELWRTVNNQLTKEPIVAH